MTSNIAVSGGALERAMTRTRTGRIAAGADERGAAAAGAAGGANTGAMRASVDGVQAGGASAAGGSGVGLSDLLPSTATVELLANGLQFMQLSYTLLAQGTERMLESVPDFDMELTSPWTIHWSSWLGWMSVFNLDFEMLSLYYDDLKWMKYISWETKFMLVVVLLPLFIGLTTVLLVKSITEIVWLSLLVTWLGLGLGLGLGLANPNPIPIPIPNPNPNPNPDPNQVTSLLVMIFGLAAHTMVPQDRQVTTEAY